MKQKLTTLFISVTCALCLASKADNKLIEAISAYDSLAMVQAIEDGADVNKSHTMKDGYDYDVEVWPITWALRHGGRRFAKALIEAGADPKAKSETSSVLHSLKHYEQIGYKDYIYIVEQGSDVNFKAADGTTPFFQVADLKNYELFKAYVDHGANVHDKTVPDGYTIVSYALRGYALAFDDETRVECQKIVELLMDKGVSKEVILEECDSWDIADLKTAIEKY